MRLGTANTYDKALQNIFTRQSELASQQEKLTSGKNINRLSDDPLGAAQAERALTRLSRVASDQRALGAQSGAITLAESTLGEASNLMQSLRELTVSAGNATLSVSDRNTVAQQMISLRDQLLTLANHTDANGIPLFGGLGSPSVPFQETATGVTVNGIAEQRVSFSGNAGQKTSTDVAVPGTMNGAAIWMDIRSGNGTSDVTVASVAGSTLSANMGKVTDPTLVSGMSFQVAFTLDTTTTPASTTYTVTDNKTPTPTVIPAKPYIAGQAIQFDGQSFVANGVPANGDIINVTPSTTTNVFKILDDAIVGIKDGNTIVANAAVAKGLLQIDGAMSRISSARGEAGEWLNRADNIAGAQDRRTLQLTTDKSRFEDLDMVKGISDYQKVQTGYQAALQSYAQVQKLSLFNYIS
ncbi:MAG: flagellar hook-associated protein 3 FlgL [Rhodoferax sp.]|jgi:flagellar hook-associated protein 3 FlgL